MTRSVAADRHTHFLGVWNNVDYLKVYSGTLNFRTNWDIDWEGLIWSDNYVSAAVLANSFALLSNGTICTSRSP